MRGGSWSDIGTSLSDASISPCGAMCRSVRLVLGFLSTAVQAIGSR